MCRVRGLSCIAPMRHWASSLPWSAQLSPQRYSRITTSTRNWHNFTDILLCVLFLIHTYIHTYIHALQYILVVTDNNGFDCSGWSEFLFWIIQWRIEAIHSILPLEAHCTRRYCMYVCMYVLNVCMCVYICTSILLTAVPVPYIHKYMHIYMHACITRPFVVRFYNRICMYICMYLSCQPRLFWSP